ncbi:LPD23 domain-containing protein [Pseudomonas sp. NPDC096950]|uniref:LPD23 domain-containing protein n=1 Tax=Pseudomonas sp. NPDC096950 TaxID=3364485 RepID=UPI00383A3965
MLNILAKSALESAVVLDASRVRSGEHLLFHPFVRKPVAFSHLTGDQERALSALGWSGDVEQQPDPLDSLAMLQRVWPQLQDTRPESIEPLLDEQGVELAIEGLRVHLRHRGMVWIRARSKALGLSSLVSFIDEGMPNLVMESDHPLAPTSNQPSVFLQGEDTSKAFLITGSERAGYRLHTFSAGESVVHSRDADSMEDLFRPEPEWSSDDWNQFDALLTARPIQADAFWNAPALAGYPNTRNSLLDMLDERYWQAQVQQDGIGALVGVNHDLFQRRFRDSVTTPWLVKTGEKYGLRYDTPAEFRMMTDAWAIAELDDETVISEVFPLIREEHDSTLAHWPDARLLALWRSGFDAVIENVQRMQNTGSGQGIIRNGAMVTDVTPTEIRETLHQHYSPAVINSLEDAGKIEFIASPHDLPEVLKLNFSPSDLEGIAGLERNGKVYLCADRISRDQIVGLFLHEVGEHAALNRMLGPDYGRLVSQFERLLQSGDPYARRSAARVPKSTPAYQVPSERLAYLVENVANEQAIIKGGEGGYALGQECLANLRAWIFRSPTSRYLDKIGQLDEFQLNSQDIAALAREAVDFYARQFSPEVRNQPIRNSWVETLDQELLDQLYMATSEARKQLMSSMSTEQALGYIYSLQSLNAPAIGECVDTWLAVAAETAVSGPDTLRVLAGQVIANHSKIQTRDRLSQQIGRQGFAIWQDDTSSTGEHSPRHLHLVTRSQKFDGYWQLTSFDSMNGPIGDTQHKHWEEALAAVSPTAHFIPDDEALAALGVFAGLETINAGASQSIPSPTELRLFHVSTDPDFPVRASDEIFFETGIPAGMANLAKEGLSNYVYEVSAALNHELLIQSGRIMLEQPALMDTLRSHAPELAEKSAALTGEAFFRQLVASSGGVAQASARLITMGIPGIIRQRPGVLTGSDTPNGSEAPRLSFAGQMAIDHDAEALIRAKAMDEAGEDADQIRQQTAWFKGVDGKWRYEIDDSRAFIKGTGEFKDVFSRRRLAKAALGNEEKLTVSDVMYHPTLFAAYPAVAQLEVRLLDSPPDASGNMVMGSLATDGDSQWIEINSGLSSAKSLSVMCHELQHKIQKIEGFAGGGNPESLTDIDLTVFRFREIERQINAILEANPFTAEIYAEYSFLQREAQRLDWEPGITAQVNSTLEVLIEEIGGEEIFSLEFDKQMVVTADNTITAREQYERLAGEVEARNVEKRLTKTEAERMALSPFRTADFAPADQIVVWNSVGLRSSVLEQLTRPKSREAIQPDLSVLTPMESSQSVQLFTLDSLQVQSRTDLADGTKIVVSSSSVNAPTIRNMPVKKAGDLMVPRLKRQAGSGEWQDSIALLPGVVLPLGFEEAASHVRAAREKAAHRHTAWVEELKARLNQLRTAPDAQKSLVQCSQRALTDAHARLQSLAKLPDPERTHHMPWDSPVPAETAARLYTTLRLNVAGMSGRDVFAELTRRAGSPQGAASTLAHAGVLGTHSASFSVFWDSFTMQLADDLSHIHAHEKLHLAYYGSEQTVDEFRLNDAEAIARGRAFGYGLNFTESKDLAGHYQTKHVQNAVLFESKRFASLADWQNEIVPELVREHAASVGDPGTFDIQLRRLSSMSANQSNGLQQALADLTQQQRMVVEDVLAGLMKVPSRYVTDFHLMPEGGARTMNQWSTEAFAPQRQAISAVETALHWRVRPGMGEQELQQELSTLVMEMANTTPWKDEIQSLDKQLLTHPHSQDLQVRKQNAERGLVEAKAIKATFAGTTFSVCHPIGIGNVYAVEISIEPSQYMRWDLPLSDQSNTVKQTVSLLLTSNEVSELCMMDLQTAVAENARGCDIYKALSQRAVTMMASDAAKEAAVARLLSDNGIQGIQYPDTQALKQGIARFNYVVFNEDSIRIVGGTDKPVREGVEVPMHHSYDPRSTPLADSQVPLKRSNTVRL